MEVYYCKALYKVLLHIIDIHEYVFSLNNKRNNNHEKRIILYQKDNS